MDYSGRQRRVREALQESRLGALLVTHLPNIRYLCGFSGSSGSLLVSPEESVFFTDGRYTQQAKAEVADTKVVIGRKSPLAMAADRLGRKRARSPKRKLLRSESKANP